MHTDAMTNEENYCFDVAGCLIIRGVLSPDEIETCHSALNKVGESEGMLGWPEPYREPFRDLLVQPTLVWYLNQLCGAGFRLERPPNLVGEAGENGKSLEGGSNEPRDPSRAYYFQNGRRLCQSVRAIWALDDVPKEKGGYVFVSCSHKSNVETPDEIITGEDDMGLTIQPELKAGDLLLIAGTSLHGVRAWSGKPARLLSYWFAGRAAIQSIGSGPVTREDRTPDWAKEMPPEQQAAIHDIGYEKTDPQPSLASDGVRCWIDDDPQPKYPSIFIRDPNSNIDEKEFYFWDLTGYLVLRNVMTPEELEAANEAVDRFGDRIAVGEELANESKALAGTGRPTLGGLLQLPEPYCEPFRKMIAHPAIVHRLNWMGGNGFRSDGATAFCALKGTSGHSLHDSNEPLIPSRSYIYQNGRSYCEAVTVTWQLRDVTKEDGGFACVPGSHKARYRMPRGVRSCDDDMGLVVHPVMNSGDVLFFMDGAQTHGALAWKSEIPRRAILIKYSSRNFNRGGGEMVQPNNRWGDLVDGMSDAQLAVMRGPDRDTHGHNVPRLVVDNGEVSVCYEQRKGALYSTETPPGPLAKR